MNFAGAIVAPLAMVANEVLPHPIVPHAIGAPRRVLCSSSLGRISYYEDTGGNGAPVVLLHDVAVPGSATALRSLFEELRGERPLVVADFLGHGFSERRRGPFTREEHARFVDEVVADVSSRYASTVDIVAIGTSCEIAASSVVRSARHVRSLTLIAPTGFDAVGSAWLVRRLRELVARGERLRDANVVADVYDALRVPTCFVHGSEAHGAPRAEIDYLVDAHAGFRRVAVVDAHSAPHVERPAATADALRVFWRGLAAKPELRLIRGEKSEGSVTTIRHGSPRAARRRTWT